MKKLVPIEALNHSFSGGCQDLYRETESALGWIRDFPQSSVNGNKQNRIPAEGSSLLFYIMQRKGRAIGNKSGAALIGPDAGIIYTRGRLPPDLPGIGCHR